MGFLTKHKNAQGLELMGFLTKHENAQGLGFWVVGS